MVRAVLIGHVGNSLRRNGQFRPLYAEVHSKMHADNFFIYLKQIDSV
ncbi:hypothetical protein ALO79_100940 [Pseudomonas syringae pv. castaneae]|uniref:Uncharacterized protein n=1 Tax=Pseudomonas syringae pv. castaneae TaxID=264450 RepID=A0A0P9N6V0_PSESX|nr:hypothetical protein ALO79_100940 [Pseudomonas syringae pv. castaneae]